MLPGGMWRHLDSVAAACVEYVPWRSLDCASTADADTESKGAALSSGRSPCLSVVVPAYNSAPYLASTLDACDEALRRCGWPCEIVVVDDGSSDGSGEVARAWAAEHEVVLSVISTVNRGRFLARWTGLQEVRGRLVLLLDSRVVLSPNSLRHVRQAVVPATEDVATVWNAHAVTDPASPLVGLFWEVPIRVFWGGYFRDPRPVCYGITDFNRYPKGTGAFLAERSLLIEACEAAWPTADAALVSDDTKLIRHIAERTSIRLDPEFRVLYRPRTSVRAFVGHSVERGTHLVDSFGGTSHAWTALLLALAVAPALALVLLVLGAVTGSLGPLMAVAVTGILVVAAPAAIAARRGCPARGVVAFLVYLPLFVVPYWLGLLRGLVVHRRVLWSPAAKPAAGRAR
jgi:hypothetical protein